MKPIGGAVATTPPPESATGNHESDKIQSCKDGCERFFSNLSSSQPLVESSLGNECTW